ncbi:MAG: hypothetical protein DI628_01815 [Blastochloris viridis]|uniref:Uncharacterized protein n=1 Tax=Blastochloris viridis TaxID=1079 RepID=A0A6N4RCC4_BLAVI|nr:MAG: hypothetical protein DI628_01815 [Blastochloris viridis]
MSKYKVINTSGKPVAEIKKLHKNGCVTTRRIYDTPISKTGKLTKIVAGIYNCLRNNKPQPIRKK